MWNLRRTASAIRTSNSLDQVASSALRPPVRGASAAILAALVLSSGCYSTKMYFASETPSAATRSATTHVFLWGMVPAGKVNLENLCGQAAISEVKTEMGPGGLIANLLTAGIWSPMTVTATCSARD